MDPQYINERVSQYRTAQSEADRDDLLYRIGTHADVLSLQEVEAIATNNGVLRPEHRQKVLQWIKSSAEAGQCLI